MLASHTETAFASELDFLHPTDPAPEEIAERTAQIRATWTPAQERRRWRPDGRVPWALPVCSVSLRRDP